MSHASRQVVGGGVSLLLLIVVGGSSVPLSPLSDLFTCRAVGYVLLRRHPRDSGLQAARF